MDLNQAIDIYCERLGPGFWAEPLNAISNAAFLIAAIAAFSSWRRENTSDRFALALILVVLATGIGSFLFHTVATRWAMLADVIPIALFIHLYLGVALRRFLGLDWVIVVSVVVGYLVLSPFFGRAWEPLLGSSASYLPALMAIFAVGGLAFPRNRTLGVRLLGIGGVFTLSLVFRMLDEPICMQITFGTHFLWHFFNGLVLYALLRVLISQRAG